MCEREESVCCVCVVCEREERVCERERERDGVVIFTVHWH